MPISLSGSLNLSGSINTNGTITATTLVVQTITSSISSITGSTNFGSLAANTHTFTGSLLISGSNVLIGTPTSNGFKFKVSNNGAEEWALNPGDSANVNNIINYNRSTSAYIQANYLASTHAFLNGYVGIGTSSPVDLLTLNVTSASTVLQFQNGGVSKALLGISYTASDLINNSAAGDLNIRCTNSQNINFSTNNGGTLAMRLTSGGILLVGNNTTTGGYDHSFNNVGGSSGTIIFNQSSAATNPCAACWNNATSGDNIFFRFFVNTGGNQKGSIDYNRGGDVTRYNTTSDGNLKNIIGDSNRQKSIEILNTTRIREYSWKDDETNKSQIGVIAQELYETFKGAVSKGSDDELLGTEDYKTWGVDKTAFTFHLIAGWQKHEQIIQELTARVQELENK
jgi:hypothetical protein